MEKKKGKRGRPKNIPSPESMWMFFLQYCKETKEDFILVHDFVGKDAKEVYRKKEKPLTIEGFDNWLFKHGIISNLKQYMANSDNRYKEFTTICSRIREHVRQDQITGGMAGIYNPSITQRLNGLVDKQEVSQNVSVVTKEELAELAAKINEK